MNQSNVMEQPESIFTSRQARIYWWLLAGIILLTLNTIHLLFFGQADALTAVMVGLHILLGLVVGIALVVFGWVHYVVAHGFPNPLRRRVGLFSLVSLTLCLVSGVTLLFTGAFGFGQMILAVHLISGVVGLFGLVVHFSIKLRRSVHPRWPRVIKGVAGVAALALVIMLSGEVWRYKIQQPKGEVQSFFPTSAITANERLIPVDETMNSASCGTADCHKDIYEQWFSSQHHYGSFSNPFYRRTVEYAGERLTDVASNLCGGCHDTAPTFSGKMSAFLDPEGPLADAGISCVGCHSIIKTEIIGLGSYVIERPPVYPFANSPDKRLQALNHFLIKMKPGPHRKAFLKGFHKDSEFCAVCHKVHIPQVINQFRWVRGFNDYDNWQQSSWSGEVASTFYNTEEPKNCQGCHMEETSSENPVERKRGFVHDHRFLGSNTVLPLLKGDLAQFRRVEQFLTDPEDPKVTVDIFAGGLEQRFDETGSGHGEIMVAPLDKGGFSIVPGERLILDVVVKNRAVGHNFPAGTTDLWSVWLELLITDGSQRVLSHSGRLLDVPEGEVDPQAHFFRVFPLDELGQWIDKGNRWDARTNLYDTTIPSGTADVVHYRFRVPEKVVGPLTIEAKLNYRKYLNYFANWVFGGRPVPGKDELMTITSDGREWILEEKPIPAMPIITMARDSVVIPIRENQKNRGVLASFQEDFLRFNDYGIGLLRQENLEGARRAFEEVVRLKPDYPDGHINLARVLIREGKFNEALASLDEADNQRPEYAKTAYFRGVVEKMKGNFREAEALFERVKLTYPRDRKLLKTLGQTYYFDGQIEKAANLFHDALTIDPEDAMAYYNLMLVYKAMGDFEAARIHKESYLKYKVDEPIKSVSQSVRLKFPHANNEAQPIHHHELQ